MLCYSCENEENRENQRQKEGFGAFDQTLTKLSIIIIPILSTKILIVITQIKHKYYTYNSSFFLVYFF